MHLIYLLNNGSFFQLALVQSILPGSEKVENGVCLSVNSESVMFNQAVLACNEFKLLLIASECTAKRWGRSEK